MRSEDERERKLKKVKLNYLFEESSYNNNTVFNKNVVFDFSNNIIEKKRPCKIRHVVKESPIENNQQILMDIHSDDPLKVYDIYMVLKKSKITEELFIIVLRRCKDVIFRDIKNTLPSGICFYPGDDINIKNKAISNINIFTKILSLITSKCYNKNLLLRGISDLDIINLFNLLKSEDEMERLNICNAILNIYDTFQVKIRNLLENELVLFYEGERTHIGIENLLEILQRILRNIRDDTFYYQIVLRFLHVKNLEYYKLIEEIIYKYCSEDLRISKFTMKYLYNMYLEVDFINKSMIVNLYFIIFIRWSRRIPFTQILQETCNIINYGLKSEYQILIEEVLKIIESRTMKNIFRDHITDILPKIFDNLYILSKKYWSLRGKLKIFKYISVLLSINHECFEKCLVKYNKKKYYQYNGSDSVLDILGKCLEHTDMYHKTQEEIFKRRNSTEHNGKGNCR